MYKGIFVNIPLAVIELHCYDNKGIHHSILSTSQSSIRTNKMRSPVPAGSQHWKPCEVTETRADSSRVNGWAKLILDDVLEKLHGGHDVFILVKKDRWDGTVDVGWLVLREDHTGAVNS